MVPLAEGHSLRLLDNRGSFIYNGPNLNTILLRREFAMPPRVYPTGVAYSDPAKCWSGFTLFQASIFEGKELGAFLIDMNGNVVHRWQGLDGFPNKMLPGGYVLGSTAIRDPRYGYQDMVDLVQLDWEGKVVWKFDRHEYIVDPGHEPVWMARQHHDFQREGNPVGYFVPGMEPLTDQGRTLILCHTNFENPRIGPGPLLDDTLIEVDWGGKPIWKWNCREHFDELGFDEEARRTMARNPNTTGETKIGDWMHINSVSYLGPNRWFDGGDVRFNPGNVICSGRQTNIMAIIEKKSGKIVWQLGPNYSGTPELERIGWIIGQHHAHLIPRGLPGAGNVLVFDNGGAAGYGRPNPGSLDGVNNAIRDYSRVIEFNPLTLEVLWQYPPDTHGFSPTRNLQLYSRFISSAQRLPNGNTFITEGVCGRLLEVTASHEIVWEYVSPYYSQKRQMNHIYRAYRLPYQWVPQMSAPQEIPVSPPSNSDFRVR